MIAFLSTLDPDLKRGTIRAVVAIALLFVVAAIAIAGAPL